MRRAIVFSLFIAAALGRDRPPTSEEIAEAYRSKICGQVASILFWEKRTACFAIRDVRGWKIRFNQLSHEFGGLFIKQRYQAIAKSAGNCYEYGIT